ncbi:MAG: DUF4249 domain-containing protein [Crocinitomicaceae bacterium]|nr:DUF4249 domain-containing protein [Flavobacteriales bacterium]NQZ35883.1 DUF4249 domain-containing protein [Crocinitomicaceae bacterium]
MNKLFFLIAILFLFSCEKEIEYEGEGKAPVLVLDGILENDSLPHIKISRSVFFLSSDPSSNASISGALVKFTNLDSGAEYVLASSGNGYYYGGEIVLPGTDYRIEVSYEGYETISSEITTVNDVVLSNIDSSSVAGEYNTTSLVNYEFNDSQEENFYAVKLSVEREITSYDGNMNIIGVDTSWTPQYVASNDPSFEFRFGENVFFKDFSFNGNLKIFSIQFNDYFYSYLGIEETSRVIGYSATLLNLSEDTYKYFKSIENNQPFGPFSDPVNVHTNVENGLGIFGSVSSSVVEL